MSLDEPLSAQLRKGIKDIILKTPRCADGDRYIACASCLAESIAKAFCEPAGTPIETFVGDVPVFTPKDVQSLINAAVKVDRDECENSECLRNRNASVVLLPL